MVGDFDLKALYFALDTERERRRLGWAELAREIEERFTKVSLSTIRGIANRARVEGDGVLQMLLWLDRTPESFTTGFGGTPVRLRPARRGKVLRWDATKIFALVDEQRAVRHLTWMSLAETIGGITEQQLKGLAKGGRVFLPDVMRVLNWLEVPVNSVTKESAT